MTNEGLERTFALNHMSYFLMVAGLRERLIATPNARIVNVASGAHRSGHLDFADLQRAKSYKPFAVYGTTKLCNILFTRELSRRLAGTGVTANCLHPGFVATRFGNQSGRLYSLGVRIAKLGAISQEKGAATTVYLGSSPGVAGVSGNISINALARRRVGKRRTMWLREDFGKRVRNWRAERELTPPQIPPWPRSSRRGPSA